MSYDFSVYAVAPLAFDELVRLVRSTAGFDVDDPSDDAESLMVVRGARRAYCFTIDGPFDVEPEDVPEEVTASIIGAKAVYQILVEGSEEASIPHSVKFARKLAKATEGAMLDEQTDTVWPNAKDGRATRPIAATQADLVSVSFHILAKDRADDLPEVFLCLARKYLPELVPRRFGHNPSSYSGNLDRDGDLGFLEICNDGSPHSVFFQGVFPVSSGKLSGKHDSRQVSEAVFRIDRAVFGGPEWRSALYRFFIAFAVESHSFHASAEVLRNYRVSARGYDSTSATEDAASPIYDGHWVGLPPYPQWWSWFFQDYAAIVAPYLTRTIEQHGDFLFHSCSEEPLDRDQITALQPNPSEPWLPRTYLLTLSPDNYLAQAAATVPPRLYDGPVTVRG